VTAASSMTKPPPAVTIQDVGTGTVDVAASGRSRAQRCGPVGRTAILTAVFADAGIGVSDWPLLAAGALIGVISGAGSYYLQRRIDRHGERSTGGRIEVLRRLHTERFEAARLLEGLLAELEHDIGHVCHGDREYMELGRDHSRRIRVESRARVAVLGDEVREALERETDAALDYFQRVDAGERRELPWRWREAQLDRKEVMLRVMRELRF